jgi:CO dehydrogenase/acetyl-CoA synthase gamma subunit (corrinoid Fe-S protein)
VESIFAKLCECSALNPDSDVEDEAGAQLFFDEAEVRAAARQHLSPLVAAAAAAAGDVEDEAGAQLFFGEAEVRAAAAVLNNIITSSSSSR